MIRCIHVNKSYKSGRNKTEIIRDLNLTIDDGEMVAILGKSGSGKSTLLNLLGTLDSVDSGSILVNGKALEKMKESQKAQFRKLELGFVLQDYALMNHQTVAFNIMLPMILNGTKQKRRKERMQELSEKVGIADLQRKRTVDLSGGERQRTAIARALANNPDILLADEPTGALDEQTSSQVMDLFERINKEGKTVVIVTHDRNIANRCQRIIRIQDGTCVEET